VSHLFAKARFGMLLAAALLALLLTAGAQRSAQGQGTGFTPPQRQEIVGILREALREDPTILRDALAAMEMAEQRDREGQARSGIARNRAALVGNPADPVRGNPAGAITVVEFFDARCPYCKRMVPALNELVRRNRDVRLVSKDLPILGPNSVLASRALLASQRQGKYAEYHDALLTTREDLTEPVLKREAEKLGLNWARLRTDMDLPEIRQRLDANLALAREIGIEGTPAFVVGDRLAPGALDLAALEQLVAAAR
jgi:protein-disulfide isomerase